MSDKKFLIICSAVVVDPLIMSAYNPLVPVLKTAFNVNVELIALSVTFHMLPLSLLCLFSGALSDLYKRQQILMYGLFTSSIGSLLGALSPNILVFLLSRSIQGLGSALIMPVGIALIGDITPREAMGKTMGLFGVFTGFFGVCLGPLIGGFLADIEWRILPLSLLAYSLIVGILSRIILRGLVAPRKKGSVSFVFQQLRHIARNRNIALLGAIGFISMFSWAGITPLISDTLSLPPLLIKNSEIGVLFSIVGLIGASFSFLGGYVLDRIGSRKTMGFGFLMMLPPMFLLTFANSYWSYFILLSVISGFLHFTMTSRSTLVVELMPEARGTVSSISNFAGFLGFASAPVAMATIYLVQGINSVYLVSIFLLLLSVLFAALIHTDRSK